jgi:hypothetical protein
LPAGRKSAIADKPMAIKGTCAKVRILEGTKKASSAGFKQNLLKAKIHSEQAAFAIF